MNRDKLNEKYLQLLKLDFPNVSPHKQLNEIKERMIEYDGFIAGLAESILKGNHPNIGKDKIEQVLAIVDEDLQILQQSKYHNEKSYRQYVALLKDLCTLVLEIMT